MRFLSSAAISHFRSASFSNYHLVFLRSSSSAPAAAAATTAVLSSHPASTSTGGGGGDGKQQWRLFSWSRALLPIALASSASFFSLDLRHSPAHCDPLLDHRYHIRPALSFCYLLRFTVVVIMVAGMLGRKGLILVRSYPRCSSKSSEIFCK